MRKRLLIVDDSIFVHEEMKYFLADTEFEIAGFAKTGEAAMEQYEKLQPDLVTMDIIMPGMDGIDTARLMLLKWPEAKIIMVSSLAYDDTMQQSQEIGAADFLFKPLERENFLEVLTKVAEKQ